MRIQYNGKSKILIRLAELVNQKADAEDLEQTAADLQKEIDEKADKSAIPTVGDGVLSVQRNGKSVGTFWTIVNKVDRRREKNQKSSSN